MDNITKNAAKIYNKYAEKYEERTKNYLLHQTDRKNFIRTLRSHHTDSIRIIDVGCGPGRDALYFQEQGFDTLCFDLSEEMLKLCRAKELKTKQGSFTDLPFADFTFEGIWSYTSLTTNTKENFKRTINKFYHMLSTKGILFLGLIEGESEYWKPPNEKYGIKRYVSRYNSLEVHKLCLEIGFDLLSFNKITKEIAKRNTYLHFIFQKL